MRPCPFCESISLAVLGGGSGEGSLYSVMCLDCNTTGPEGITRQQAEYAWDQRIILYCLESGSQLQAETIEGLEKISDQADRILIGIRRMVYPQMLREKSTNPLRFDGLYQSDKHIDLKDNCFYWNYLRFYENGMVLGAWTTRQTKEFIAWLERENESSNLSRGFYKVIGNTIRFSTVSSLGVVEYEGTITDGMLELEYRSETNGKRGLNDFRFVSFAGLAPAVTKRKIYAPRPGEEFDYIPPTNMPEIGNGTKRDSPTASLLDHIRTLGRSFRFLRSLPGPFTLFPTSIPELRRRPSRQN